ncbi:hypothetical protein XELAEV_18044556mg [Xenopus laevis]|uniref:Uncharacterized protein n=1 Tax=Xenopus laevis TaxID=8355 RepID=A0A974BZ15_XENLA|nr:hypothetical protein XELAEV_18044556mg [Xenopus laevis]
MSSALHFFHDLVDCNKLHYRLQWPEVKNFLSLHQVHFDALHALVNLAVSPTPLNPTFFSFKLSYICVSFIMLVHGEVSALCGT